MAKISKTATGVVLALTMALIVKFEGYSDTSYADPPGMNTICYGHKQLSGEGHTATKEECAALLARDLSAALNSVARLVRVPLTVGQWVSFTDFVYNTGQGTFARSSILKEANEGHMSQACKNLKKYVYAGGRKLNGLKRRRQKEYRLCIGK